jgi:hypothetical protein
MVNGGKGDFGSRGIDISISVLSLFIAREEYITPPRFCLIQPDRRRGEDRKHKASASLNGMIWL